MLSWAAYSNRRLLCVGLPVPVQKTKHHESDAGLIVREGSSRDDHVILVDRWTQRCHRSGIRTFLDRFESSTRPARAHSASCSRGSSLAIKAAATHDRQGDVGLNDRRTELVT